MVAFSTKYMLRSILAALKRRRKKSLARKTKTFWRKKGFPGLKTPFAKPFPAIQKLRTALEIATIYLEQVIKQNDWTLLPFGRHFCLWFYGRARAKEIWALDNRLTNQTKVPFVVYPPIMFASVPSLQSPHRLRALRISIQVVKGKRELCFYQVKSTSPDWQILCSHWPGTCFNLTCQPL